LVGNGTVRNCVALQGFNNLLEKVYVGSLGWLPTFNQYEGAGNRTLGSLGSTPYTMQKKMQKLIASLHIMKQIFTEYYIIKCYMYKCPLSTTH